jgi:hypothetical protein
MENIKSICFVSTVCVLVVVVVVWKTQIVDGMILYIKKRHGLESRRTTPLHYLCFQWKKIICFVRNHNTARWEGSKRAAAIVLAVVSRVARLIFSLARL